MPIADRQKEMRQKHIGASESAAVLGLNPYASAYDLWMVKTGRVKGFEGNEACELGNMIEDGLLDWAAGEIGEKIVKNQYRVHAGGILSATHDALSRDDASVGYEAKTAGLLNPWSAKDVWGDAGTDEIPDQYLCQCQHQMLVSNLQVVVVPALIGGRGRVLYRVARNEVFCNAILEECERFWRENVQRDMPPTDCVPKLESIKRIIRQPDKIVPVDSAVVKEWLEAKDIEKQAKKLREEREAAMLALIGDAEAAECELGRLLIKTVESARFDRKAFREVHPELDAEFTKTSMSQRLSWKASA